MLLAKLHIVEYTNVTIIAETWFVHKINHNRISPHLNMHKLYLTNFIDDFILCQRILHKTFIHLFVIAFLRFLNKYVISLL